jgi:hypothetical protein
MFIDPPPKTEKIEELVEWCEKLHQRVLQDDLFGSATWNPGNLVDDDTDGDHLAVKAVTVTGAALGDYAIAAFSLDVTDLQMDAQVTAADTVTCTLSNSTDGAVNLGSGTVYVRVFKRVQ